MEITKGSSSTNFEKTTDEEKERRRNAFCSIVCCPSDLGVDVFSTVYMSLQELISETNLHSKVHSILASPTSTSNRNHSQKQWSKPPNPSIWSFVAQSISSFDINNPRITNPPRIDRSRSHFVDRRISNAVDSTVYNSNLSPTVSKSSLRRTLP
jgi:hypothetical protein